MSAQFPAGSLPLTPTGRELPAFVYISLIARQAQHFCACPPAIRILLCRCASLLPTVHYVLYIFPVDLHEFFLCGACASSMVLFSLLKVLFADEALILSAVESIGLFPYGYC